MVQEEKEQIKEQITEERKQYKSSLLKIVGIVFIIFGTIVLFFIKYYNEKFPLIGVILIEIGIIFLGLMLIFAYRIQERFQELKKLKIKEEEIPEQITVEEARKVAENILKDPKYADYIDDIKDEGIEMHGEIPKSTIYCLECIGLYFKGKYFIGINCHYPNKKYKVLIEPNTYQINRTKKLLASHPEKLPDIEKTTAEDILTGRKVTTEKIKHKSPSKKESKDEGGVK